MTTPRLTDKVLRGIDEMYAIVLAEAITGGELEEGAWGHTRAEARRVIDEIHTAAEWMAAVKAARLRRHLERKKPPS